jgi:protoheme IX farnesyltransferase
MMMPRTIVLSGETAPAGRRWADFLALTKPRVVLMVLLTTAVGFHVGSLGPPGLLQFLHTLLATALSAAGVLALNQFLERDTDALMARTRSRPLPDGRIQPGEALAFGMILASVGLVYLALVVNGLSVMVTAVTAGTYLFLYTPLKRRSSLCTVVGAIPGALPPVTGWVAARGEFGAGAWVLFGILFLWQLPHSLAIASIYRADYARAGLCLLPVIDPEGGSTGRQMVMNAMALLPMGLLPTFLGIAGRAYFLGALALGVILLACTISAAVVKTTAGARRLMFVTLIYLPALFGLMALDKIRF